MINSYWSNSRFADFVRGTKKPKAGTMQVWDAWERDARAAHPVRYWITETAFDAVQSRLNRLAEVPENIGIYFYNRFVSRSHVLSSPKLKPGKYYEINERVINCMFEALVDYVEVECAHANHEYDYRAAGTMPPFSTWQSVFMHVAGRRWRHPQAGIDRLLWEASLVTDMDYGVAPGDPEWNQPTHQATRAQEALALYMWWQHTRPARPDPYAEVPVNGRINRGNMAGHLRRVEITEEYAAEDVEMMVRLTRLVDNLWT